MFTLSWDPPFAPEGVSFSPAEKPIYLGRMSVNPELLREGSIVGLSCARKAVELARRFGADTIRCELNPEIHGVYLMMDNLGFVPCHERECDDRTSVFMQKRLTGLD
jgi:hypothetical protein